MQTEFIKLAVIFIVIMVMVLAKLKLRDAMIVAIFADCDPVWNSAWGCSKIDDTVGL